MIDNFDIIKPLFYFNEANNMFFHLQILRRGKDHPELPAANKLIRSWLVRSREQLGSLKDEIVFLCEHYKARAYINVAGKDFNRLNTLILKKLADNVHTGNIINPWHVYNSACGACPSQWDIFTDDDRYIYARYRWGWLSLTLNCGENNSQVIFAQAIGDELDGCMDLGELIAITSPLLDWSGDVIYN